MALEECKLGTTTHHVKVGCSTEARKTS